jgi:hypothetical protein
VAVISFTFFPVAVISFTFLVVISTDCNGRCNSNGYHTIGDITDPPFPKVPRENHRPVACN